VWKYGRQYVQSATAENRRGKKKKEKETTAAEYNGLSIITYGRP